jgi:hypothetical protein
VAHYSRLSKPLTQFTRHPEYHGTTLPGQDVGLLIQRLDDGQARD